jgi:hypothetical protein
MLESGSRPDLGETAFGSQARSEFSAEHVHGHAARRKLALDAVAVGQRAGELEPQVRRSPGRGEREPIGRMAILYCCISMPTATSAFSGTLQVLYKTGHSG